MANAHGATQIEGVLAGLMVKRPNPKQHRSERLCAAAGSRGKNAMRIIPAHGYIPWWIARSKPPGKNRNPMEKARRCARCQRP